MPESTKVEIAPGMGPFDFRLGTGKELRVRFVDRSGAPVPGVYVMVDRWRGGEALYNVRHPNVLDTRIPNRADDAGIYLWPWAPGDAVTYRFSKGGFAEQRLDLTADVRERTVTLSRVLRITGEARDAATGRPVAGVTAIPVLEFGHGRLIVERQRKKTFPGPSYAIEADRTDVAYRVQVEARGYRTALSEAVRVDASDPTRDFRLEPAPPVEGRVVDAGGRPVPNAQVLLATSSQNLGLEGIENKWPSNLGVRTDFQGEFSFPAQFERYAVVAIDDAGYAEAFLEPDRQPGEMALKAWARVEGRLVQDGRPVPSAWVHLHPLRLLDGSSPHIQDGFSAKTDRDGRFAFPRVPPIKSRVWGQASVWRDGPLTSGRSVPLDLRPGGRVEVDLGGGGTTVTGHVVPTGGGTANLDLHKSLNYLLRKGAGIEPPAEFRLAGPDARAGWSNAWTSTAEGHAFLQTLDHTFVTLDRDGRFTISGVPAGEYDFAIRLYEPPAGNCLVTPVGSRIVRFRVTDAVAQGASLDLGDIPVEAVTVPQPGEPAPGYAVRDLAARGGGIGNRDGKYVLLDFWATYCRSCVADLPALRRIHEAYRAKGLVILGVNLDEDPAAAVRFVEERRLPWFQGAPTSGRTDDPILSRYGVGSVPTYVLIGPDGRLIRRGESLDEIDDIVRQRLR
jgi:thiol-disulfide isomerase/thioredoxin/uncharacterized GH25 family protein